jgi:hypothetical protein
VVLALAAYMPFEEFLLKWLPVPDIVYSVLRLGSESAVYLLFLVVTISRITEHGILRRTPIDNLLILFVAGAILSAVYNGSNWSAAAINLRTMLRYVFLFYTVVQLDYSERDVRRLLAAIIACALAQVLAGTLQSLAGVSQFWLPRQNTLEVAGFKKEFSILISGVEQGAVIGTWGHSVSMALFVLVALCVACARMATRSRIGIRAIGTAAIAIAFMVLALLSYSKGVLFCALVALPAAYYVAGRPGAVAKQALFVATVALIAASVLTVATWRPPDYVKAKRTYIDQISYVVTMFSERFVENAKHGRIWLISEVGGRVLGSGTLIGFGPDQERATVEIARGGGAALAKVVSYEALKDVYWIAILLFYGIFGLTVVLLLLWRMYRYCRAVARDLAATDVDRVLAITVAMLAVFAVPLNLLVRAFEFRSFSFFLWLLFGVMVSRTFATRRAVSAVQRA